MSNTQTRFVFYPAHSNGSPNFSNKLAPVVAHRFPDIPAYKVGLLSRDVMADSAAKAYVAVVDFKGWLETDVLANKTDHHVNEVLAEDRPVRPYLDVEWDPEAMANEQGIGYQGEESTLYDVLLMMCDALVRGGFGGARGISVYCASGMSKGRRKASYHILFDTNHVFSCVADHKRFMEGIVVPLLRTDPWKRWLFYRAGTGTAKKCVIDTVPYMTHQNFRLPFQSKWTDGTARPLLPFDLRRLDIFGYDFPEAGVYTIGCYEDPVHLTYVSPALWTPVKETAPKQATRLPIVEQDQESSEFPLVAALSGLLTTAFLTDYENARNVVWLLWGIERTERMRTLIHECCRKAPNYSSDWVEGLLRTMRYTGFTLGSLRRWAEECTTPQTVAEIVRTFSSRISYAKELRQWNHRPPRIREVCVRYLSEAFEEDRICDVMDDVRTLVIQSHLGTGKTVVIRQLLEECHYHRILLVSPRRSYTHSQMGSLVGLGVTSYLDVPFGTLAGRDRIIVQVESLHRIRSDQEQDQEPYDIVIMDESESILGQLHSLTTNAGNMIRNHETLEWALRTTRKVVFADAFLSDRTLGIAKALRGNDTLLIHNTYQPYNRQAIRLLGHEKDKRVPNLDGFCERIMDALRAGRRIVVIWTSKRRGDWFVNTFLTASTISYRFYCSTSSKEEQEGLQDVATTWAGVQCLMMTTSITVGISYDPKVSEMEFDEAFLYGTSASAIPRDIAQSLLRVRVLKAQRLTYVMDTRVGYYGMRGLKAVEKAIKHREDRILREHPLVQWKEIPAWARFNHVYNENEARISRAEYREVLELYLKESGYDLTEETHLTGAGAIIAGASFEEATVLDWEDIDDIGPEQADEVYQMMKRGEATTEMIWMHKKWVFRGAMMPLSGESVEDHRAHENALRRVWRAFYVAEKEGQFWNVYREKRMTLEAMVRREATRRFAVMVGSGVEARRAFERFLGIVGMRHSQEEMVMGPDRLEQVGAALQAAEKEIREGMGLRPSRRKKGAKWKMSHTIDLIKTVLEEWGRGTVSVSYTRPRGEDGKQVKVFTIVINKGNTLWELIRGPNVTVTDEFLIEW